ncbi:MAG: alpha/beta hydrolase [Gammaproteobacteria bacterium]|nr:alpha/beta hydrolase [Gammaproteobacteria bacterium]
MDTPYQSYGKHSAPVLLFAHANGFPPDTYTALLSQLGHHYRILAPHLRPLWQDLEGFRAKSSDRAVWQQMAQDQNAFIEQHQLAPVTYIGHSMGANVGVLAAQLKPHLYRQLILIEPVFLRQTIARMIRFFPQFLINKAPIVVKALGRPDRWANHQQAYDFHRSKRVFSKLSDDVLWHYINAAVVPDAEQVTLLYSKYWEALMYGSVPNIWPYLKRSKVPISVLRGESSDTVDDLAWKRWQAVASVPNLPKHTRAVNFVDAGHLLPLEQPIEVAVQIKQCML